MVTIHFASGEKRDFQGSVEDTQATLNTGAGGTVLIEDSNGKSVLINPQHVEFVTEALARGRTSFDQ